MQVAKWGNSLALRLPKALVDELGLKEGDEVAMRKAADGALEIAKAPTADEWLAQIRAMGPLVPAGTKHKRSDAYPKRRGGSGRTR